MHNEDQVELHICGNNYSRWVGQMYFAWREFIVGSLRLPEKQSVLMTSWAAQRMSSPPDISVVDCSANTPARLGIIARCARTLNVTKNPISRNRATMIMQQLSPQCPSRTDNMAVSDGEAYGGAVVLVSASSLTAPNCATHVHIRSRTSLGCVGPAVVIIEK